MAAGLLVFFQLEMYTSTFTWEEILALYNREKRQTNDSPSGLFNFFFFCMFISVYVNTSYPFENVFIWFVVACFSLVRICTWECDLWRSSNIFITLEDAKLGKIRVLMKKKDI